MSSASKSTSQAQQFEITTKKKFGKNLNKLTKPPPPASTVSSNANKSNASSRNGLLLLSTKRPSSSVNTKSSGGILATKSAAGGAAKPLPLLGLQNKSNASTHDALLGAVVGASRLETHEPDAWGVAEKVKSPMVESTPLETSFEVSSVLGDDVAHEAVPSKECFTPDCYEKDLPSTNWDEYGGRNYAAGNSPSLYEPNSNAPEVDTATGTDIARTDPQRPDDLLRHSDRSETSQRHQKSKDQGLPQPRMLYDPNKQNAGQPSPVQTEFSRQPVIQVSSYDDRSRADRNSNSTTRMLYDPKSGSMVAVPSRDDAAASKSRKDRGKKGKNSLQKETKGDPKLDTENGRNNKRGKRDKKQAIESASPAKAEIKRGKLPPERKLPRTCGVLYTRDNKGNYVSADGCDGDLGYGSHSVPGGRINNASAYKAHLEEQKNNHGTHSVFKRNGFDASREDNGTAEEYGVALEPGLSVPEESQSAVTFEWVKPDEKIELVTGVDESPTLQATAKEWAPSQAALAAAASRLDRVGIVKSTSFDDEGEDEEEDDGPFGLGFDPTLNMDSMMQSPSVEPANGIDSVDLASLSLEPAYSGTTKSNHIFAFGAGSTWGASDSGTSNSAWGAPSSGNGPASFLNIPSGQTWGGMSSFAGAIGGASLNGDTSRTTGD